MPVPDIALPVPTSALVERAAAFRAKHEAPVLPKPAATVILLRDAGTDASSGLAPGIEVFMLRRVAAMAFAAGMHVFPGGGVDEQDHSADADPLAAMVRAAVREVFEETGVMLASPEVGEQWSVNQHELETERLAVLARETSFEEVLLRHGLAIRAHALRSWSHWVTPEFEPRRYDTRFFVALMPSSQDARDVGGESDVAEWVRPRRALAAQERGEWLLMPPTEVTLRELAAFESASDAFDAAGSRRITPLLPTLDLEARPPRFVITGTTER